MHGPPPPLVCVCVSEGSLLYVSLRWAGWVDTSTSRARPEVFKIFLRKLTPSSTETLHPITKAMCVCVCGFRCVANRKRPFYRLSTDKKESLKNGCLLFLISLPFRSCGFADLHKTQPRHGVVRTVSNAKSGSKDQIGPLAWYGFFVSNSPHFPVSASFGGNKRKGIPKALLFRFPLMCVHTHTHTYTFPLSHTRVADGRS